MRRRLLITAAAAVILGGAVAGLVLAWGSAAKEPAAGPALPLATAEVTRSTLVETKTVLGTLGYGDLTPISATGTGTITWIAPIGSTVERGKPLFKVDERPVVALYGSVPVYRTLDDDANGADVQQLQENLAALGYTGFTIDGIYASATAESVRIWQRDLGLTETGTVEQGQVIFLPGSVRIAEHTAHVGDVLDERGAAVLSYTGTARLVTIELKVADQALVAEGRTVMVTVPGGGVVEGKISEVGTVATAQEEAGAAPGGTSSAASDARIGVSVTIADQTALGSLEAAPVDVDLVSEERKDVLTVPVAALLALAEGGFGVEIVDGDTTRTVAVKTGLFAAGRVEVSGEGISEGLTVGVPEVNSSGEAIVTLRGVSREYPGGVVALRAVDLDINRRDLVAIVGPSGSGKSTMLNLMGTLDRPSAGQIVIDGFDIAELSDRELSSLRAFRIGFVFQHFHLAPGVSALDNVADGLLYTGAGLRERRERAEAALRLVGLGHRLAHRPHELSGGEKQRTAIARAVVGEPALLLADEPTGALDSHSGEDVMRVLLGLHETGATIVVITHERVVASHLPRQVSLLDGRVVDDRTQAVA